jgi:catechol 2,3-dioxygenase-like lactoylglutathione lyase family enzyme
MLLDAVRIAADDLPAALRTYAVLLGTPGVPAGDAHRFALARGAVELVAGSPPGIRRVVFVAPPATGVAIDHVVVRTADPARAIALWRERLGVRLAFDREFPARGLRLLFFRSNGITLEYAAPHPPPVEPAGDDVLWGVSYRVPDLAAHRAALSAAGVDVSEPRPGNKTGTTVATVRSGTCGVPTLLLQNDPA